MHIDPNQRSGGSARPDKIVSATEAVRLIHDGDTIATSGFVGIGFAENLAVALEDPRVRIYGINRDSGELGERRTGRSDLGVVSIAEPVAGKVDEGERRAVRQPVGDQIGAVVPMVVGLREAVQEDQAARW